MTGGHPGLVGRAREQLALRELLEHAAAGRASGLALEGDAGIGKTALLRWLRREAAEAGFTCLDTVGPGAARATPYAALVELLAPLRQRLDELDESAVLAGLLTGGGSATPQLVAARFLRAVAALAEREPVLVVVDDAQWIDDASAGALATLARRIEVDRVAVVVASREPLAWWHPTGWQSMVLEGLAEPDAVALLADVAGLAPDSARDCWRLTGGNPLALLALGSHWRGEFADEPAALPQRLRDALDERLAGATTAVPALLALALDRTGDESVLRDAVPGWDRMIDAGVDGGVVERLEGRLQFTHPLLRARILDASSAAERRTVHAALAAAACAEVHRHARAWHLAESVTGPDDEVAELLAQAADHARHSGAPREAMVAFRRAADLSEDHRARATRCIDAAEMAWLVGDHPLVEELLDEAAGHCDDTAIRGRIAVIRGQERTWQRGPLPGYELLRGEAESIAHDEPGLAAACLGYATFSALVAVRVDLALEVSERAMALSADATDPAAVLGAQAARASALILAGRGSEADALLDPVEQLAVAAATAGMTEAEHLVQMVAMIHTYRERWERARELLTGLIQRGRATGALDAVALATGALAEVSMRTGRWAEAYGLIRSIVDEEWGEPGTRCWPHAFLARVCAARGLGEECRTQAAAALEVALPMGLSVVEAWAHAALGLLELGRGRPRQALVHLDRVAMLWSRGAVGEPGALWWEGDHLDALVASGEVGLAKERLDAIERELDSTGRGYAAVVVARGRALLAPEDDAELVFADAVATAEAFASPFELGRTLLARARYRARLGLDGAASDAERAAALFDVLGAVDWVRQARGRDGEARRLALIDQLTAAELRVAMAVARGLTNREASIDLCVSTKTIDYHLGNIYRKLGVRTRTEMTAQLLGAAPGNEVGDTVS